MLEELKQQLAQLQELEQTELTAWHIERIKKRIKELETPACNLDEGCESCQ